MRSSSTHILKIMDGAANPEEVEPLLDEMDEGLEPEVVVETKKVLQPNLQQKIQSYIARFTEVQLKAVPKLQKPRVSRQYIYLTIFLAFVTTAIAAPTLFMTLMRDIIFPPGRNHDGDRARLRELRAERDRLGNEINDVWAEAKSYREKLGEYLMPFFKRWWAYDEEDSNCIYVHDKDRAAHEAEPIGIPADNLMCYMADRLQKRPYPVTRCLEIAKEGCEVSNQHPDLTEMIDQKEDRVDVLWRERSIVVNEINNIEYQLESDTFYNRLNVPFLVLGVGIGLAAIITIILASMKYRSTHVEYKYAKEDFYRLSRCLPNREQDVEMLALMTRLFVPFYDHSSIKTVVASLKAKSDLIQKRWNQRVAFLSGADERNKGAPIHTFFHSPGSRETKKIILEMAGLGPKQEW